MADDLLTLNQLIVLNDMNAADLEVSDLLDDAPLLMALAATTASNGTQHKYTKETGAPVVGFRAANAGRDLDHSDDQLVTIDLKILDASFAVDKAIADAYGKGGAPALIARELKRHLKAAFAGAESQILYGVGADAGGFVGLADAATLDSLSDDETVVGAGGSGADLTSVYLIRSNDDGNDCTLVAGNDAKIDVGETVVQSILGSNNKSMPAYYTPVCGWLGLQIGSKYSVVRIANIGKADHKLTDDLIFQALELFPSSRQPTLIAMSRRSQGQLRDSRTATNATGAPAPRPTEVEGIPIVTTDHISNSEDQVFEESD